MDSSELRRHFDELISSDQRQAAELTRHLHAREKRQQEGRAKRPLRPMASEEFVGIWRDRPDHRPSRGR